MFVNTREDATGDWIACETGAPAGYNRCYLQLSTGEFVIAGTEGIPGFAGQGNKIFVKVMDSGRSVQRGAHFRFYQCGQRTRQNMIWALTWI